MEVMDSDLHPISTDRNGAVGQPAKGEKADAQCGRISRCGGVYVGRKGRLGLHQKGRAVFDRAVDVASVSLEGLAPLVPVKRMREVRQHGLGGWG